VLVVVSMARATWLDGHWLYVAEELPPALMRAGVPWLIGLAVRQYIVLGRRADRERELRQVQRLAELKERATADRLADRKSTRLNSSHVSISYAVFCLKKKKKR